MVPAQATRETMIVTGLTRHVAPLRVPATFPPLGGAQEPGEQAQGHRSPSQEPQEGPPSERPALHEVLGKALPALLARQDGGSLQRRILSTARELLGAWCTPLHGWGMGGAWGGHGRGTHVALQRILKGGGREGGRGQHWGIMCGSSNHQAAQRLDSSVSVTGLCPWRW